MLVIYYNLSTGEFIITYLIFVNHKKIMLNSYFCYLVSNNKSSNIEFLIVKVEIFLNIKISKIYSSYSTILFYYSHNITLKNFPIKVI